jgi:hypothetical protein
LLRSIEVRPDSLWGYITESSSPKAQFDKLTFEEFSQTNNIIVVNVKPSQYLGPCLCQIFQRRPGNS